MQCEPRHKQGPWKACCRTLPGRVDLIPLAMGKSIRGSETGRSENLLYLSVTG